MAKNYNYDHYKTVPDPADKVNYKKKKPKLVAVVDEDGEISGTPGQVIERFPSMSLGYDALTETGESNYYKEVLNRKSQWVWWMAHEGGYTNAGGSVKAGTTFSGAPAPKTNSFVYGRDGNSLTIGETLSGYNNFNNKDEIDVSIILVTHDLPMALEICSRSVILNNGKITANDNTYKILKNEKIMSENRLELPFGFALHHLED